MKALFNKKRFLIIAVLLLLVVGAIITIKKPIERFVTERIINQDTKMAKDYCYWYGLNANFNGPTYTISPPVGMDIERLYSNLDNVIDIQLTNLRHTDKDHIRVKIEYINPSGDNYEMWATTGDHYYGNWNAGNNQMAAYYVEKTTQEVRVGNNTIVNARIKITLNGNYNGNYNHGYYWAYHSYQSGTYRVTITADQSWNSDCDAKEEHFDFQLIDKYYNFDATLEQKAPIRENNPVNKENKWELKIENMFPSGTNPGLDFNKISVKIYDENNVESSGRFNWTKEWWNGKIIFKNKTDKQNRPHAGIYRVVVTYDDDQNFTTRRTGDERLIYEFTDMVWFGYKNFVFEPDTTPVVQSWRYSVVNAQAPETHTLQISSINDGMVEWSESYEDINFGDPYFHNFRDTIENFKAKYAAYEEVNIDEIAHGENGKIAIPVNATYSCYYSRFFYRTSDEDETTAIYKCLDADGQEVEFSRKYINGEWVDNVPFTAAEIETIQAGAGYYDVTVTNKGYENSGYAYSRSKEYTYTAIIDFEKKKPRIELEDKMETPLVTNGGLYKFYYRFEDLDREDFKKVVEQEPKIKIVQEDTGEEYEYENNDLFKIIWDTEQSNINSRHFEFYIRYFNEELPATEDLIKKYEGSYYLSVQFPDCEERRIPFSIHGGELDFYIQASVDRHENINPLQTDYPPSNMDYEWNIGFFLMRGGTQSQTKSVKTINAQIFDRQVRVKPEALNEDGTPAHVLTAADIYYIDTINYTIDVLSYKNDQVTYRIEEVVDNAIDEPGYDDPIKGEVQTKPGHSNGDGTYTDTVEFLRGIYGREAIDVITNFFAYDADGNIIKTATNNAIKINFIEQKMQTVVVEDPDDPSITEEVTIPGDTIINYSLNGVLQPETILIDPSTETDFASMFPDVYKIVVKYLQLADSEEEPNKNIPNYGIISGTRETDIDINGDPIVGHEVTDQFTIDYDYDNDANVTNPVAITPKTEVVPGAYYVYVGCDALFGVGYSYNPEKGAISKNDYPEMMNVNIHEAKIVYIDPKYTPKLQEAVSSNSGNKQSRMYYNADSESKLYLETGNIKYFNNNENGVHISYKYEYLPYSLISCPSPEQPCVDRDGDSIEESTHWQDITTSNMINIDPVSFMTNEYIASTDENGVATTPHIYAVNHENCEQEECEFSPMGYYRVTWYYSKDYVRQYSTQNTSNRNHTVTVYGSELVDGQQVGTSSIFSNVSKFYGMTLNTAGEDLDFVHNFETSKTIYGSLNYVTDPSQIEIGGVYIDTSDKNYYMVGGVETIPIYGGTTQANVLQRLNTNGQAEPGSLRMRYDIECKYGDSWEKCINAEAKLATLTEGSDEYNKYLPYRYGAENQDFRIIIRNVRNYPSSIMLTPQGTYDVELSYTENETIRPIESVENADQTVTANFTSIVHPDSYDFSFTSTGIVLNATEQYIQVNLQSHYINEEFLSDFTATVYGLGTMDYTTVSSGPQGSNYVFHLDNPLIVWTPTEDENVFKGVLKIHINPAMVDNLDKFYKLTVRYADKERSTNLPVEDLTSWLITEESPIIHGEYKENNVVLEETNLFYRNLPGTTIDVGVSGPYRNNAKIVVTQDCASHQCIPSNLSTALMTKHFTVENTSGTDGNVRLTYKYGADPGTSTVVPISAGDYQIVVYYRDTDYKVVDFTVKNDFIKLILNNTRAYTMNNGEAHDGLFINKPGNITSNITLYGANINNLSVRMYRSSNNSQYVSGSTPYLSFSSGSPFTYDRDQLRTNKFLKITYNNQNSLKPTVGDYIIKFYLGDTEIKADTIEVLWDNDETNTIANQLKITLKQAYFDFSFVKGTETNPNPEYNPDPAYPNVPGVGRIIFNVTTDELVKGTTTLDNVRQTLVNNVTIKNSKGANVKNKFTVSSVNNGTTGLKIILSYSKTSGVTKDTYTLETFYTKDSTEVRRNKLFSIGDYIKWITITNKTIDTITYDNKLHNNMGGSVILDYLTEYALDIDYLSIKIYNSNNEDVSERFNSVISGNQFIINLLTTEPFVPAGTYRINIQYTENPLKTVELNETFDIGPTYNQFEISDMRTASDTIYADVEGQTYSFAVEDTFFSNTEKGQLKARVYDEYDNLIYSQFPSDNVGTTAFTMTNTVASNHRFVIGINAFKVNIGRYYVQLFLDQTGSNYYVSNRLAFTIDDTKYRINISDATRIIPKVDITKDGTIYDKDGADVRLVFRPNNNSFMSDLSVLSVRLIDEDGNIVKKYVGGEPSGENEVAANFVKVKEDLVTFVKTEFDTGPLPAGDYVYELCINDLMYNNIMFEVVHFVPVTNMTVKVGNTTLGSGTISLTKSERANLTVTFEPSNATVKTYTINVANTNILTVENGVVTPKTTGSTTITVTGYEKTVTGTVSIANGLTAKQKLYQIVLGNPGVIYVPTMPKAKKAGFTINDIKDNLEPSSIVPEGFKVEAYDPKENKYTVVNQSKYNSTLATTYMRITNGDGTKYILYIIGDSTGYGSINIGTVSKRFSVHKGKSPELVSNQWTYKLLDFAPPPTASNPNPKADGALRINDVSLIFSFFKGKQDKLEGKIDWR